LTLTVPYDNFSKDNNDLKLIPSQENLPLFQLVMNMFDKKQSDQDSVKSDSLDDEVIIDLTDEILVKTEDDNGKLELSENLADDAQFGIEADEESEVEEDEKFLTLDEKNNGDSQRDEAIINLDDQVAEDQGEISDDQLIASAMNASLGSDDNETDEDVFDLEEDIELDYESDDDETEPIELDDERTEDNQDFVDLMLGASNEPAQDDNEEEPTEYLEFGTEEKDVVIVLDADRDQDTQAIAPADEDTPEFVDNDDLPDLEAIGEFDFESEEDEENGLALDEPETDSSDDIIARTVEQSLGLDDDRHQIDIVDEAEFGIEDDDAIMDLAGSPDDDGILTLAKKEPLKFADDELLDWDEGLDLEADDEVIPLDGFNNLEAEDGEEIIEITEFDEHFPADGEALLKQSGMLDASDADEEDFLELIDIEEDRRSDDEEIVNFSDSLEDADDDKINQFFNDELEEDQPKSLTPESIFSDDPGDISLENKVTESIFDNSAEFKSGLDDEVLAVAEETHALNPELTADADSPVSEDQNFDLDSISIAQQVDRLDTFLSEDTTDEPEIASLPVDQVAEAENKEETGLDSPQIGQGVDGLPAMPAGQIDAAIERIINEKFSGKIEGIIYEVIEKAVAKEIDRLKGALTGRSTIDDYED